MSHNNNSFVLLFWFFIQSKLVLWKGFGEELLPSWGGTNTGKLLRIIEIRAVYVFFFFEFTRIFVIIVEFQQLQ